jgi:hypothetical protein
MHCFFYCNYFSLLKYWCVVHLLTWLRHCVYIYWNCLREQFFVSCTCCTYLLYNKLLKKVVVVVVRSPLGFVRVCLNALVWQVLGVGHIFIVYVKCGEVNAPTVFILAEWSLHLKIGCEHINYICWFVW